MSGWGGAGISPTGNVAAGGWCRGSPTDRSFRTGGEGGVRKRGAAWGEAEAKSEGSKREEDVRAGCRRRAGCAEGLIARETDEGTSRSRGCWRDRLGKRSRGGVTRWGRKPNTSRPAQWGVGRGRPRGGGRATSVLSHQPPDPNSRTNNYSQILSAFGCLDAYDADLQRLNLVLLFGVLILAFNPIFR
jgi:hypothetical protein